MGCTRLLVGGVLAAFTVVIAGCSLTQSSAPPGSTSDPAPSSDELITQWLASEATALGIVDPPKVDLIRTITPDEFATVQVACMQSEGFDARLTSDGEGIDYSAIPPEQSDQLRVTIYTCESKYPIGAIYLVPLNESQLRILFDYRAGDLSYCISEHGYTPDVPPSLTTFIEAEGDWSPYDQLTKVLSPIDLTELIEACPQSPALETLFPE